MNKQSPLKKIIIVGVSASGKSTFARKLSKKTGIKLYMMDEMMWTAGWNYIGDEETIAKLKDMSTKDEWILEGYIDKSERTFLLNGADVILYLNYNPLLLAWRYISRCIKHHKTPRPELPGSPDKFSFKFLKLVMTKGEAITLQENLYEIDNKDKILRFNSPQEADRYLLELII